MEDPLLLHPPPPTTTTTTATTSSSAPTTAAIILRLSSCLVIASIAIWANLEASKGIQIIVLNSPTTVSSPSGRHFNLMFVANGHAYRLAYEARQFVERAFNDDKCNHTKRISHVTIRMSDDNFTGDRNHYVMLVRQQNALDEFAISISPSLMPDAGAVASAIYWGIARASLFDGQGEAPPSLVDAMATWVIVLAGFDPLADSMRFASIGSDRFCLDDEDQMLAYLIDASRRRRGFVAELNQFLHGKWNESALESVLSSPVLRECAANGEVPRQLRQPGPLRRATM